MTQIQVQVVAKPIEKPVNEYVERVVEATRSDRVIFEYFFLPPADSTYDDSGMHRRGSILLMTMTCLLCFSSGAEGRSARAGEAGKGNEGVV